MSADNPIIDPFADEQTAPLAQRPRLELRLRQHLADPVASGGALLLGRRQSGKSSQLRQFQQNLYDISLGVMLPLDAAICRDEATLLRYLAECSANYIIGQGYAAADTGLLPEPYLPHDDADGDTSPEPIPMRVWLADHVLPVCFKHIRNQRRLVWFLDDAHHLIDAIVAEQLPGDLPEFLRTLLGQQLAIIGTTDLRYEEQVNHLSPLVESKGVYRLHTLTHDAVAAFYRALPQTLFTDETITFIYQLTGGEPVLVDQLARQLYVTKSGQMQNLTEDDVKQVIPQIHVATEAFFRDLWDQLSQPERLVLTALSNRQYVTPIDPVTTPKIATWLAEIDLPLDDTSINAALRGLTYLDVVDRDVANVRVRARLMQQWLLENAHIAPRRERGALDANLPGQLWMWLIAGLIGLLLVVGIAASITQQNGTETSAPVPTVTLVPNDSP